MADRAFQIRARAPSSAVIGMAKAMHHAAQQANILRHGVGNYCTWEKLPEMLPGHQEQWIAAAEAGFAHIFSSPDAPLDRLKAGAHHG